MFLATRASCFVVKTPESQEAKVMENSMKSLILSLSKSHDYSFSKSLMIFAKESHVMEPKLSESQEEKVTNNPVKSLILSLHKPHDYLAKVP